MISIRINWADKLFISNKAVSKWETGASIPDTTLLIPLADLLGVTVTELLTYQRITPNTPIDSTQVENLVKAAINYTEEEKNAFAHNRRSWSILYFASVLNASSTVFSVSAYPVICPVSASDFSR